MLARLRRLRKWAHHQNKEMGFPSRFRLGQLHVIMKELVITQRVVKANRDKSQRIEIGTVSSIMPHGRLWNLYACINTEMSKKTFLQQQESAFHIPLECLSSEFLFRSQDTPPLGLHLVNLPFTDAFGREPPKCHLLTLMTQVYQDRINIVGHHPSSQLLHTNAPHQRTLGLHRTHP